MASRVAACARQCVCGPILEDEGGEEEEEEEGGGRRRRRRRRREEEEEDREGSPHAGRPSS